MSKKYTDRDIKEARAKLWRMGSLEWKLDPTQKKILDFYKNNTHKVTVINASRRLGKTYYLTIAALEQCLKVPKSIVSFLQPEQKMVRTNVKPIMDEILLDCPKELMPKFNRQDNIYTFSNGSQIHLAGTDNGNMEKLRGKNYHLAIIDEAGFCSELKYIINSIIMPGTLLTQGKIILSSTPPRSADHEFGEYLKYAGSQGNLVIKTIYDALEDHKEMEKPRITLELIEDIIRNLPGGKESDDFKREYLCELLNVSNSTVVPEFTKSVQEDTIVEWPKPPFCDKYVSMDIGFEDLTVVLFSYYDFEHGVIVVEDELVMNGHSMTTDKLAEEILKKEDKIWTNPLTGELEKPTLRISDNNMIVINDLARLHSLYFLPTQKDNKDMQVNQLRMLVSNRQLIINPRCKTLISHLQHATWNKARSGFSRSTGMGHYDAVDALIYLVRNIDRTKNPFPKGYKYRLLGSSENLYINERKIQRESNAQYDRLNNQFRLKSSIRLKK